MTDAKCPACDTPLENVTDMDSLQDAMEEHIKVCLRTRKLHKKRIKNGR